MKKKKLPELHQFKNNSFGYVRNKKLHLVKSVYASYNNHNGDWINITDKNGNYVILKSMELPCALVHIKVLRKDYTDPEEILADLNNLEPELMLMPIKDLPDWESYNPVEFVDSDGNIKDCSSDN